MLLALLVNTMPPDPRIIETILARTATFSIRALLRRLVGNDILDLSRDEGDQEQEDVADKGGLGSILVEHHLEEVYTVEQVVLLVSG